MEEIKKRLDRILIMRRALKSKNEEMVEPDKIAYFTLSGNRCIAVLSDDKKIEMSLGMNFYEKYFGDYFIKVHRSFLVAVGRINGFYERYPEEKENQLPEDSLKWIGIERLNPVEEETRSCERISRRKGDECELSLQGISKRIPVTENYSKNLKKLFGLKNFCYLLPEHPHDKKLRLLGLIDFGWRDLDALDPNNTKAVEEFKKKWDIKQFSKNKMLSYFRQYGTKALNKKRMMKNILYQIHRWIKKGIEPLCSGNIRSMWYKVKAVLARHSDFLTSGDVDMFYTTLQEMVEVEQLFRYKDFGFMDMNEPYRGIGTKLPHVVLASEKRGHYIFIKKLAQQYGVSFVCMNGEPASISLEYFSDDLKEAIENDKRDSKKPLSVYCISDVDPAGYSIENSLVTGLKRNGHCVEKVIKLVDTSIFSEEDIDIVKYPVVKYEKKGNSVIPFKPATVSHVTKARQWWESIGCHPQLISEVKQQDGKIIVTIFGIESDSAETDVIKERFRESLGV